MQFLFSHYLVHKQQQRLTLCPEKLAEFSLPITATILPNAYALHPRISEDS